jgi:hypothetical protein
LRQVHPPSRDPSPGDQPPGDDLDLDAIAAELADVEVAMERIQAGTYWTDEVTGAPITDEQLAANPTTRRAIADTAETDDPAPGFAEMADVLADLDAAGDAAELDVAELDALADAEFLAELGRLDGEEAGNVDGVDDDVDDVGAEVDDDGADDLEVELVMDEVPDPPADPPAR